MQVSHCITEMIVEKKFRPLCGRGPILRMGRNPAHCR